ncbi:unnamed protein product, partial [Mesorhabditis spiculigera]
MKAEMRHGGGFKDHEMTTMSTTRRADYNATSESKRQKFQGSKSNSTETSTTGLGERNRQLRECDSGDGTPNCCPRDLLINLDHFDGWDFVVAPREINVRQCVGDCTVPHLLTTRENLEKKDMLHLTRNDFLRASYAVELAPTCCHIDSYAPLDTILIFPNQTVTKYVFHNVVALSCSCF